jgi:hypothetical protein
VVKLTDPVCYITTKTPNKEKKKLPSQAALQFLCDQTSTLRHLGNERAHEADEDANAIRLSVDCIDENVDHSLFAHIDHLQELVEFRFGKKSSA